MTVVTADVGSSAVMISLGTHLDRRNVAAAREALDRGMAAATEVMAVDMSHLRFIDAAGLGLLTAAHLRCERSNRQLVLHNCSPEIRRVLAVTRLNRILRLDRSHLDVTH